MVQIFNEAFWLKYSTYAEQPLALLTHSNLILFKGEDSDTGLPITIQYGSDINFQNRIGKNRMITVSVLKFKAVIGNRRRCRWCERLFGRTHFGALDGK